MHAPHAHHEAPAPSFRKIGINGCASKNAVQKEQRSCITGLNPKQDAFLAPDGACLYLRTFLAMPVGEEPFRLGEEGTLRRVLCFPPAHNSISGRFDPIKEKCASLCYGREDEPILEKRFEKRLQSLLSQYPGIFSYHGSTMAGPGSSVRNVARGQTSSRLNPAS